MFTEFLERVYDQVLEDFNQREQYLYQQCHVINCDITDNHEDATIGAIILSQLMDELITHDDIDAVFLRRAHFCTTHLRRS